MAKKVVTNDGKKGGWLVGKRHYDKNGKSLGGIKAVVTDAGGKPVELEGGEVIINREASKKYWKELSKINQSAGNGVPIEPPTDAFDEDPAEDYENGGKIEFNANHIPNKWILNYAIKIKEEHPEVWALGGNIFGNQAFINLKRVAERGHWLDSEEWMYKKWRSFVARHKGDFRIQGVIAMLKWVDKVDKGWQYMKNLIEEEIKKREAKKSKKMNDGGNLGRTPSPASERIKGSKFNASGSAKDSKSGASIKFDDKTIASIQSLIDAHNEKYPSKKITLGVAKAVVRRGMGAYSSSHRPTITGGKPNSRTAWGLARLKAFIHKAEKGKSKSGKYSQDNDLFDDLDIKVSKFDKGGEIEKGIKAEYEHAKTIAKFKRKGVSVRDVARSIAEDHLKEDPHYYSKLEKMEGKKFATGGIVENGISINIGDTGLYGRSKEQITITGITTKIVNFTTSDGKKKGIYIDSFAKNYIPDNASNYVKSGSNKSTSPQTSGEWRVKTWDELKEQGLLDAKGKYFGISDYTINRWGAQNLKELDKSAFTRINRGENQFEFDGYTVKSNLFTKDPLPLTQSNVVHELSNYRIKTEQEFINEYGSDWRRKVGWLTNSSNMDWLFGEKITDIVTSDMYNTILEIVKNENTFTQNNSAKGKSKVNWSIRHEMYMFDPALYSQNVDTNLGQNKPKDLRPSTDSNVWDATFKVGDIVYIRKDMADFVGIDFDSNDNVFKIVTEKFEPTSKSPQNKTGKIYRLEQVKNIANKRIFELEGKDIALVDINQAKPKEFGDYILKKSVTADDFKDIKINVNTRDKSEAFQKLMFSLGIDWRDGQKSLKNTDKIYLLSDNNFSKEQTLGFASNNNKGRDYYKNSSNKEIKFDDLFELKSQAKPVLSDESLKELFKDVKEIDKEREALETIPQKNETQINDELKSLEDEYNDLLFLIDLTPSTDVDNMLSLKLQAKQLKDKIDLLHLDLKKKIDGELQLLDNLFNASSVQPQERYQFNAYNDGFAPDGQPTSLPKNLYDWTMTQEFQNWFGNFTNAYNYRNSSYENVPCSVVVNKHYEPLVVYHGTGAEFSFFKFDKFPAMYFAENEAYSNWFAEMKGQQSGTRGYVYPFFLNIRTPLDLTIYGIEPVSPGDFIDWMYLQTGLDADELKISKALLDPSQKFQAWRYLRSSPEMLNVLRDKAICDGIVYYEDNPSVDKTSDAYKTKAYIVFNSNSAKIADPNREMMTIPAMRSFYLKRGGKL